MAVPEEPGLASRSPSMWVLGSSTQIGGSRGQLGWVAMGALRVV